MSDPEDFDSDTDVIDLPLRPPATATIVDQPRDPLSGEPRRRTRTAPFGSPTMRIVLDLGRAT